MASNTSSGVDPTLYLYTSLTAGSSHIITATSRLETILKANKIPFRAIDCATDEKARSLWSRRSKGRKIPGLVKYGQVIGDLDAVEEWNEYGEIKENIDGVSDILGDTPMTDTPMPPPAPITLKDPLARPEPPSRSSTETRHISISEPSRDRSGSPGSSTRTSKDESPMNIAMRQAGAEAAAKASQRKASGISSLKTSSTSTTAIPAKRDSADTTPSVSAMKMSLDAEEPSEATEITAGKTPVQLASEGAKKSSVDKIAETTSSGDTSPGSSDSESMSNEEQMLEARRHSSIAKAPSRLQQEMSIDDVKSPAPETAMADETSQAPSTNRPSQHRGSSLSEASKEEIKKIERKNAIEEESEESGSEAIVSGSKSSKAKDTTSKSTVQATDKAEADVMKGSNPQDQQAKDADAAGVSAAAALFLSPSSTANLNRLSADSTSVYSFFDSAFSPAPLFSGSKNLDLDLSFMDGLEGTDPRFSTSTYGTNGLDSNNISKSRGESINDETPRASQDTQHTQRGQTQQDGSPRRERFPSIPVIAPLRTPARRQVSEPLLSSTQNRISTPSSVPLPLTIRKSPTNPSANHSPAQTPTKSPISSRQPASHSQPDLLTTTSKTTTSTSHPDQPNSSQFPPASPITSPNSPSTTASPPESQSRSLRFKKSIRSLRSKKSTQKLNSPSSSSPSQEMPPSLPAGTVKQLREIVPNTMSRSVSDSYGVAGEKKRREKSGVKNLLCF